MRALQEAQTNLRFDYGWYTLPLHPVGMYGSVNPIVLRIKSFAEVWVVKEDKRFIMGA